MVCLSDWKGAHGREGLHWVLAIKEDDLEALVPLALVLVALSALICMWRHKLDAR
jgi:hypothetical protein